MLENINLRKTELKSKLLQDKSEESLILAEKKNLEEEKGTVDEALEKNRVKLSKCENELRTVSDRSTTVKNEIQKYSQSVISLKSRYESLRNLTERYEGYGQSIKKVMERKENNKKVIGVVADIIEAPAEYETAIETALGGSIQNIVTEDEATAKEMISYLRTNKLGRATFLPITSVVGRGSVNPDALKEIIKNPKCFKKWNFWCRELKYKQEKFDEKLNESAELLSPYTTYAPQTTLAGSVFSKFNTG